jgi:ribokinase
MVHGCGGKVGDARLCHAAGMEARTGQVIVVGSINVDLIVGVAHLPSPGETVLGSRFVEQNGGKSANQAVAAARAGAAVTMLGAVGDDDLGRRALAGLAAAGVDVAHCAVVVDEHTGLALIVVDEAGENQIAVASGANARLDGDLIRSAVASLAPAPGAVCLLGFEVGDEAVLEAARWASGVGLRLVLDPAPARALSAALLRCEPVLTPNEVEAEALSGETDPEAAARALQARTGAPVVVTMGAEGALLFDGRVAEHLLAPRVETVDTTGAGDALDGILAAELARGTALREALRMAITGAALKTTVAGAQAGLPTREEIVAALG